MNNEKHNIANVEIKGLKKNKPKFKVNGESLPFYQNKKTLKDLDVLNRFIKATEHTIRTSKEYKAYKNYLFNDIGLNYDVVMPEINQDIDPKITLEMHHGPILTLYDYCVIVTRHLIKNDINVTSFRIFDIIMQEHFLNHIQVMTLCDLNHKLFHAGKLYINPRQAWGNINPFLEKYSDGIDDKMETIINKNIDIATRFNSYIRDGVLDFDEVQNWDNPNIKDR